MGNQQDHQDPKAPAKGGGSNQSKGQAPKPGNKGGQDQVQQRSGGDSNTGGSRDSEHGSTRSYSNDQERAGDSGQKSHE
jgi:hypothetical protein